MVEIFAGWLACAKLSRAELGDERVICHIINIRLAVAIDHVRWIMHDKVLLLLLLLSGQDLMLLARLARIGAPEMLLLLRGPRRRTID